MQENNRTKQSTIECSQNILKQFVFEGKIARLPQEQNNQLKTIIYFIVLGLYGINIIVVQQLTSHQTYFTFFTDILQQFYDQKILYEIVSIIIIFVKILLISSVLMEIVFKKQVFIVSWVNKKFLANYSIIKQVDLLFSALMVLVSLEKNIGKLISSGLISLFHIVYMQNYINRKDPLYASSSTQFLKFRGYLLLCCFANAIFLILKNESYLVYFYSLMFCLLLSWYISQGHQLYIHSFSKAAFHIVICIYLTLHLAFLERWINNVPYINFTKFLLVFCILVFVINLMVKNSLLRLIGCKDNCSKILDLSLYQLLEQSASDKDSESTLIGIIKMAYDFKSKFPQEYLLEGKIYDSYLKQNVACQDIYIQKQSIMRIYVKSCYEKISQKQQNGEKLLQNCQFLLNAFGNVYEVMKFIQKTKMSSLNIIQKVKIEKMELFVKQENEQFNQQLYGENLQIEKIIELQELFSSIKSKIDQYVIVNIDVWGSLQLQEIKLSELSKSLKKSITLITEINKLWKPISKFFKINKAWRFIYLNYVLLIRNQKVKQKQIDFFTNTERQQNIFSHQNVYIEESSPKSKLYDSSIMFSQNSCCLFAVYEEEDLYIKDVNYRFQKMTGYTRDEIRGSSLSIIMPPQIVAEHKIKFEKWIKTGYLNNEDSYLPKFTSFINKQQEEIPSIKYYKVHYHLEYGIVFVCLLKQNVKPTFVSKSLKTFKRISSQEDLRYEEQSIHIVHQGQTLRQFQYNQDTNLSIKKNIFLKQQNLQPKQTIRDVNYLLSAARVFTILIIISIIILTIITSFNSHILSGYSNQFINFVNIYRLPFLLGTNYMKQILKIGDTAHVNDIIASTTAQFLQISGKPITSKTIFDKNLNPPNIYYAFQNNSIFQNKGNLSQIDLFYSMVSSVATFNTIFINKSSEDFKFFKSYLKPSYEKMMNTIKNRLHEALKTVFSKSINEHIWFITAEIILLCVFLFILLRILHRFINKMKNIFLIFLDFRLIHVSSTYRYWKGVRRSFNTLFLQESQQNQEASQLKYQDEYRSFIQAQTPLNNETKKVQEDRKKRRFYIKIRALLVLIILSILLVTVSIQFYLRRNLKNLRTFEHDGFFFLRYFPVGSIVDMGCMEKYYSDHFPKETQFKPTKYDNVISAMSIFGQNQYIGEIADPTSSYYTKQKNYFFGSPCEFNPTIASEIGVTVEKCLSVSNGTFKEGISSYIRYGQRLGESCIRNKVILMPEQIDESNLADRIKSAYVQDAIITWANQFSQKVANLQIINFRNSAIIIVVILVIHFVAVECLIANIIQKEYEFARQIYIHFVPEFILAKEKVIKQKFIIQGIISK